MLDSRNNKLLTDQKLHDRRSCKKLYSRRSKTAQQKSIYCTISEAKTVQAPKQKLTITEANLCNRRSEINCIISETKLYSRRRRNIHTTAEQKLYKRRSKINNCLRQNRTTAENNSPTDEAKDCTTGLKGNSPLLPTHPFEITNFPQKREK